MMCGFLLLVGVWYCVFTNVSWFICLLICNILSFAVIVSYTKENCSDTVSVLSPGQHPWKPNSCMDVFLIGFNK